MEKLKDILRNNQMSGSPYFYSGRGATLADLNSDILAGIHKGIKKEFGKKAAKNFVKMVAGIKVLSATTFLNELYSLHNHDWEYVEKEQDASGVDFAKNEDGSHNIASGMGTIAVIFGNNGRDQTGSIRGKFLHDQGIEVSEIMVMSSDGCCYVTNRG